MALQTIYCRTCGGRYQTNFVNIGGVGPNREFCGMACSDEFDWIKTLGIMNKAYYPQTEKSKSQSQIEREYETHKASKFAR